ncbi:MAG: MoaD/ThiS family protein [Rhodospirillales bacterium]|nr:MoaD/ThiS family protein [Rhodospirillales bacterium]
MKITLKLYAVLGQYLPDHAKKNEAEVEVEDASALTSVLAAYGVPPEHCHLVLVNGHYIAPSERADKILKEGDALAAWPPVAGG